MSVPSPSMIDGFATDTMVVSIRIMKNPSTSAHSAGQGLATVSLCVCILFLACRVCRLTIVWPPDVIASKVCQQLLQPAHFCRLNRAGVRTVEPVASLDLPVLKLAHRLFRVGELCLQQHEPTGEQVDHGVEREVMRLTDREREFRILVHGCCQHACHPLRQLLPTRFRDLVDRAL